MASATHGLLLLTILLPLLSVATAARPCKTILFISTNPSSSSDGDRYITFFFTNIRPINPNPNPNYSLRSYNNPIFLDRSEMEPQNHPQLSYASVGSSLKDRTIDIISVVGALLFGVGCGALTAATMYLIWSMFSPPSNDYDYDDGDENDYDSIPSPKKMGYVAIPAVTTAAPPPAKEVE
ncbi:hypothetical protein LguiA_013822 [Lonicera macranthoides]